MATSERHFEVSRQWQEYYEKELRPTGMRAPSPVLGQTVLDYRRETDRLIKRTFLPPDHDLYKVNYRGIPADVLNAFEPQLLAAARVEAWNPNNVPKGELRERVIRDPRNNQEFRCFIGQDSFVKLPNFGTNIPHGGGFRPGRRVISFRTDKGFFDASGRGLR